MKNVVRLMVVLVLFSLSANSWATYKEVAATADTWMNAGGPDTAYSGLSYLWIGAGKSGLVNVDMTGEIPADQVITSAYLDVYITYTGINQTYVYLYSETDAWVEASATWNTSDGSTAWGGSAGGFGTGMVSGENLVGGTYTLVPLGTSGWFQFDVTEVVQAWYDGSAANKGLLLQRAGGGEFKFYSLEGANAPKLNVTYEYIPEPATLLLLSTGVGLFLRRGK